MIHPTMVRIMDDLAREWADEGIEVYLDGQYRLGQARTVDGANASALDILSRASRSRWNMELGGGR